MLVVTTPTGRIGSQVLDRVLDAHDGGVRVLVREPGRLAAATASRVEIVRGSLTDPDALAEAFDGSSSVFWLLPPDATAQSVEEHLLAFARPLRDALVGSTVQRVVYVTGFSTGLTGAAEDPNLDLDGLIAAAGVSTRALRLPALMENLLQQVGSVVHRGTFSYPVSPDRPLPTVATRDVADAAARLLTDDSWTGREILPLLGAEDLSYDDMARTMSDVLGRPVRYQQADPGPFEAGLVDHGMAAPWARSLTDLLVAVDGGLYDSEPRTPASTTPTTFAQWCRESLRPAVLAMEGAAGLRGPR